MEASLKATLLQYQIDGKGAICSFALTSGQKLSTKSALFLGYLNLQQNSVDFATKQCGSEQSRMFNFYLQIESLGAPFNCTDCPKKNFSLSVLNDKELLPLALLLVEQCDPAPVQVAQCNVLCF